MTTPRVRLDQLLVDRGLVDSRTIGRALIMAGDVTVDGCVVDKAGTAVPETASVQFKRRPRFVSRAGEKLAHALEALEVDPKGARALDVGASTGGFVDCLLQHGALEVIALDVGYGQLDVRLRNDPRVIVMERVNARWLQPESLPFSPDLLTVDVSFISLAKVLPAVIGCMAERFTGLLLVKPQFEAGAERVGKGGIVRDPEVHEDVLRSVGTTLGDLGLAVDGLCDSGLPGVGGNVEFVFRVDRGRGDRGRPATLEQMIAKVVHAGNLEGASGE
ncbi:MAG: TlyA family RNA methyltransferase [Actinobacteria bacterium]|nr:TlyA family RNA methyltransferase [Actinomycetota bacterium]